MMRKIISAILTLVMCVSMVGGLTAGAEETTVYTYNFIWNATTNSEMDYKGLPNELFKNYSSDVWEETERNWKYHGMSAEAYAYWESYKNTNDGRGVCGFDGGGVNFTPQKSLDWFTLQLRVPEAGLYKLSYIAPVQETNVTFNKSMHVGILPTSWTESSIRGLQNGVQTGMFYLASGINLNSTFSASANNLTYVDVGTSVIPINTDGGEVVVSFSTADTSLATLKNKIRFRGFRLTKVTDEINLTADEVILEEGGATATVTASLKNNVAVRSLGASYEIANTEIATVTSAGVITPKAAGQTTLTARIGDVTKTINVEVKGQAKPELTGVKTHLEIGDEIDLGVKRGDTQLDDSEITYTSSNTNVAAFDDSGNGILTAKATGKTNITAKNTQTGESLGYFTLRVYRPEYTAAFGPTAYKTESASVSTSVVAYAASLDGELPKYDITATKNETTGTYAVSAPEEIDGYKFLYWIKGLEPNKQIVSLDKDIAAYAPHNNVNYLIAVYDKEGATAPETEYYNANGQKLENGDTYPYMAGYGQAEGWIDHKNGVKEAKYGEPNSFKITVAEDVAETIKASAGIYRYGDSVTFTAPESDGTRTFLGWKKTVNGVSTLVSVANPYTFYAWEDCTIEPLYRTIQGSGATLDDVTPSGMVARKILLGTFDIGNGNKAVMAEFIGFDDAVERGITLGAKDYSMTQKGATQFVIENNVGATAISGYAILANGTKYIYTYTAPETEE